MPRQAWQDAKPVVASCRGPRASLPRPACLLGMAGLALPNGGGVEGSGWAGSSYKKCFSPPATNLSRDLKPKNGFKQSPAVTFRQVGVSRGELSVGRGLGGFGGRRRFAGVF
jgi:hypothetical protein